MAHIIKKMVIISIVILPLLSSCSCKKHEQPYIEKVDLKPITVDYVRDANNTKLDNQSFDLLVNKVLEYKRALIKIYKYEDDYE